MRLTRNSFRFLSAASLSSLLLLGGLRSAHAVNDVDRTFSNGSLDFGTLSLTNYGAHSSFGFGGVEVGGTFFGNYPPLEANIEARWVQLVSTSHPSSTTNAPFVPYFDPGEQDGTGDYDPFYWNTSITAKDGTNYGGFYYKFYQTTDGEGIHFYDMPARSTSSSPVAWEAELSLVLWETGSTDFGVLWSGSYGFGIDTNGTVTASGFIEGSLGYLTQESLSASFPGWTMSAFVIPEPGTLALGAFSLLAGLGWYLLLRRRE